jgi:hypothetical protein
MLSTREAVRDIPPSDKAPLCSRDKFAAAAAFMYG